MLNYHYQASGYHPFICFVIMTVDLVGTQQLRGELTIAAKISATFLNRILNEYLNKYPDTAMSLRGDSGFITAELYSLCETFGTSCPKFLHITILCWLNRHIRPRIAHSPASAILRAEAHIFLEWLLSICRIRGSWNGSVFIMNRILYYYYQ